MVGKTNMDQFASGLVGTRTPYGVARNPFDERFIPGGSSSGSASAVGNGLVTFALGTDVAGSESRRLFMEACERMQAIGGQLVQIRFEPFAETARLLYTSAFMAERYAGIRTFLEGKGESSKESVGVDPRLQRVTAAIMSGALAYSAVDVFDALTRLNDLKRQAELEMDKIDMLLVPTSACHYSIAEIEAEEKLATSVTWAKNTNLGRFTNFVNLLDMAAVAVPSGILRCEPSPSILTGEEAERAQHLAATGNPAPVLPFGVTMIGPAWSDDSLAEVASRFHAASSLGCGPAGHAVKPYRQK
ncbi:hypothetical protein CVIRNUC_009305 [Coccomyxa viridis]|uniref:Amidase domain-containing protein n=1 Tax=Coccomyxa viridis TaxID=1274662 RepID=A0AAV1IFY1_9CHLO|nr:hypothetical protein CVIRNUC_009305 [Coccomyxa viridis]